jgi:hypothetical protein
MTTAPSLIILDIELEQGVGAQRLRDVVEQGHVRRVTNRRPRREPLPSAFSALAIPVSVSVTVLCFSSTR